MEYYSEINKRGLWPPGGEFVMLELKTHMQRQCFEPSQSVPGLGAWTHLTVPSGWWKALDQVSRLTLLKAIALVLIAGETAYA